MPSTSPVSAEHSGANANSLDQIDQISEDQNEPNYNLGDENTHLLSPQPMRHASLKLVVQKAAQQRIDKFIETLPTTHGAIANEARIDRKSYAFPDGIYHLDCLVNRLSYIPLPGSSCYDPKLSMVKIAEKLRNLAPELSICLLTPSEEEKEPQDCLEASFQRSTVHTESVIEVCDLKMRRLSKGKNSKYTIFLHLKPDSEEHLFAQACYESPLPVICYPVDFSKFSHPALTPQ